MRAWIARMTEDNIDQSAIEKAGEILKNGGLAAFPTETVYGLGGNALDAKASEKIYAAKGRPVGQPADRPHRKNGGPRNRSGKRAGECTQTGSRMLAGTADDDF